MQNSIQVTELKKQRLPKVITQIERLKQLRNNLRSRKMHQENATLRKTNDALEVKVKKLKLLVPN